jgi:hypothetical protein
MESPDKSQQDTESLSAAIENAFDELASKDESDNVEDNADEMRGETVETGDDYEGVEASDESDYDAEEHQEISEELQEEIQDAADSDYNEPAPERWPDEMKEVYNSQPPAVRQAMLENLYKPMQRRYTEATQQLSEMRKTVEPMLNSLNQHQEVFQRMGVNPQQVFETQMAWAAHLQRVGAEQGLKDMAQAYGVGGEQPIGQGDELLTPFERAMKQQVEGLQQQVAGFQQHQQQTETQAQQQQFNAYKQEIETGLQTFINEKTNDGKPKHPHVEQVASNIAGIIRGGLIKRTDDYGQPVPIRDQLAQAYDMACNLDPSIRPPVGRRQASRASAAQKVDVVSSVPAGRGQAEDDEMDISSFIEKTYDSLSRRSA